MEEENKKFDEENVEVDVLVILKSNKSGLTDEEIMSVPSWLSSSQFSARVATAFRYLINKEGCKFLIMRKFQEKFGQFVTLKKGVENFLVDRAKFEAIIFASTQDLNFSAAYNVEEELGLTLDQNVDEFLKPKSPENFEVAQHAVGGFEEEASIPFTCLSSVSEGPLPPAVKKSGSFSKIPSLLRYDHGKAANEGLSSRYMPPPMNPLNSMRSDKFFSLSFPAPPKNSSFAKEVVSVPPDFGRGSRRGRPRCGRSRRSPMPTGRWRRDSPPSRRFNRSRSRSFSPPSRKYYNRYARSRSPRERRRSPSVHRTPSSEHYRRRRRERSSSSRRSSQSSTVSLQSSQSRLLRDEVNDDGEKHANEKE